MFEDAESRGAGAPPSSASLTAPFKAAGCTTYSTLTCCDGERDLWGPMERSSISSIALDAREERVVELVSSTNLGSAGTTGHARLIDPDGCSSEAGAPRGTAIWPDESVDSDSVAPLLAVLGAAKTSSMLAIVSVKKSKCESHSTAKMTCMNV